MHLALQAGGEAVEHGAVRHTAAAHLRRAQVAHTCAAAALLRARLARGTRHLRAVFGLVRAAPSLVALPDNDAMHDVYAQRNVEDTARKRHLLTCGDAVDGIDLEYLGV